jgi:hypothetical protein
MSAAYTSPLKRLKQRTQADPNSSRSTGLFADLNISLKDFLHLNVAVEMTCYRIANHALISILRSRSFFF